MKKENKINSNQRKTLYHIGIKMDKIKKLFLTTLRDKNISRRDFRDASEAISHIIAQESLSHIETETIEVETPIAKTTGIKLKPSITLIPILRSGMAMVQAFLHYYKDATIGVIGLKRDEETAKAHLYYQNIPPIAPGSKVIILDPMISTGGTGIEALKILKKLGIKDKDIIFASIICSPEGIGAMLAEFPRLKILQAGIDEKLNHDKFIVPGLGDFGDRYYGTEG